MNAYTRGVAAGGGAPWPLRCQHNGVKLWDLIELRGDPIHCGQQTQPRAIILVENVLFFLQSWTELFRGNNEPRFIDRLPGSLFLLIYTCTMSRESVKVYVKAHETVG